VIFETDSKEERLKLQPSYKDISLSDSRDPPIGAEGSLLYVKLNIAPIQRLMAGSS
jgi:hypothetical protein